MKFATDMCDGKTERRMGHISNESFKCNGSMPNSVGGGGSKPPNDTSHWSTMGRAPTGFGGGGSKPPNDKNGINLPGFIQFTYKLTNILYNVTTYYSKISTHI